MFPAGLHQTEGPPKLEAVNDLWTSVGKSYKSHEIVQIKSADHNEIGEHFVKHESERKSKKRHSSSSKSKSKHHKKGKKVKKDPHPLRKVDIGEESNSFDSDSDVENDNSFGPGSHEIIYLVNGKISFSQKKTIDDEKIWRIDDAPDRDMILYEGSYRLNIPSYELYTPDKTIKSEFLTKQNHKLPTGVSNKLFESKADARKNGSFDRKERYFGMIANRMNMSLQINRLRIRQRNSAPESTNKSIVSSLLGMIPVPPLVDFGVSINDESSNNSLLKTDSQMYDIEALQLNRAMNSVTASDPKDPHNWLRMVLLQGKLIRLQKAGAGERQSYIALSLANRQRWTFTGVNKVIIERQTSVLEHAIKQCSGGHGASLPDPTVTIPLYLYLLHLLEASSEPEAMKSHLIRIVKECPASLELRLRKLSYSRSLFASCTMTSLREGHLEDVSEGIEDYKNKMAAYNFARGFGGDAGSLIVPSIPIPVASHYSESLIELCLLEMSAGYTERAIALLQALLDIHVLDTNASNTGRDEESFPHWNAKKDQFEKYWESEYPRIGEGWTAGTAGSIGGLTHDADSDHIGFGNWQRDGSPSSAAASCCLVAGPTKGRWDFGFDVWNDDNGVQVDMNSLFMGDQDGKNAKNDVEDGATNDNYDALGSDGDVGDDSATGSLLKTMKSLLTQEAVASEFDPDEDLTHIQDVILNQSTTETEHTSDTITTIKQSNKNSNLVVNPVVTTADVPETAATSRAAPGENDEDGVFVYSRLHGYHIRVKNEDSAQLYKKILGQYKDMGDEEVDNMTADEILRKYLPPKKQSYAPPQPDDPYLIKYCKEWLLSGAQWRPLRALAESDAAAAEEQPYRVIFFSDLSPSLLPLTASPSPNHIETARMTVLALRALGLYFPFSEYSHSLRSRLDPILAHDVQSWGAFTGGVFHKLLMLGHHSSLPQSESTETNAKAVLQNMKSRLISMATKSSEESTISDITPVKIDPLQVISCQNTPVIIASKIANQSVTSISCGLECYLDFLINLIDHLIRFGSNSVNVNLRNQLKMTKQHASIAGLPNISTSDDKRSRSEQESQSHVKIFRSTIRGIVQNWQEQVELNKIEKLDMRVWVAAVQCESSIGQLKEATKVCNRSLQALHESFHASTSNYLEAVVNVRGALELHWLAMRLALGLPVGQSNFLPEPDTNDVLNSQPNKPDDGILTKKTLKNWRTAVDVVNMLVIGAQDSGHSKSNRTSSDVRLSLFKMAQESYRSLEASLRTEARTSDLIGIDIDSTPAFYHLYLLASWHTFISLIFEDVSKGREGSAIEAADDVLRTALGLAPCSTSTGCAGIGSTDHFPMLHYVYDYSKAPNLIEEGETTSANARLIGLERLHISRIELYLFAQKYELLGARSISKIQVVLRDALRAFPRNGTILQTFFAFERRLSGGYLRMKSYAKNLEQRLVWGGGLTPVENFFEIFVEVDRSKREILQVISAQAQALKSAVSDNSPEYLSYETSIIHNFTKPLLTESFMKLKDILERFFEDPRSRQVSALWIFYIDLYVKLSLYDDAKRTFLRAIQSCSYCKDLWMLSLGPLRRCFDDKEMKGLVKVMEEKGIHMRSE